MFVVVVSSVEEAQQTNALITEAYDSPPCCRKQPRGSTCGSMCFSVVGQLQRSPGRRASSEVRQLKGAGVGRVGEDDGDKRMVILEPGIPGT